MDIKQIIKEYLNKEKTTLTEVINTINKNRPDDQKTTVSNISNKLSRGTIKYNEVEEIAKALGYDLVWQEIKKEPEYKNIPMKSLGSGKTGGFFSMLGYTISSMNLHLNEKDETTITDTIEVTSEQSKQMRKSFEMGITYEISILLDKILDYALTNLDLDDRLKAILNHVKKIDSFAINSRLDDSYVILNNLFVGSMKYMNISMILGHLRVIYKHGGLESLSDDELNDLLNTVREYNENNLFIKED